MGCYGCYSSLTTSAHTSTLMPLMIECDCGKKLAAPDGSGCKKAKCRFCERVHQIPALPTKATSPQQVSVEKRARALLLELRNDACRQQALQELRALGDAVVVPAIVSVMDEFRGKSGFKYWLGLADIIVSFPSFPLEPLFQFVQSNDTDLREFAAPVLGRLGHPWGVDALVWAIRHPLKEERSDGSGSEETNECYQITVDAVDYLYAALTTLGRTSADRLLSFLALDDPRCPVAVEALRQLRDQRAIPKLVPLLLKGELPLKMAAGEALREFQWRPTTPEERSADLLAAYCSAGRFERVVDLGPDAVQSVLPHLLKCLEGPESDLRQKATVSLGAVSAIVNYWKVEGSRPRLEAIIHLGNLRHRAAVEPLLSLLRTSTPDLRGLIVDALAKIGDSRAIEPLLQLLAEEIKVADLSRIIGALGNFGDARVVRALTDALRNQYRSVRQSAAYSLAELGDPGAIPTLLDALNDVDDGVLLLDNPYSSVRGGAIVSLGRLGSNDPALHAALKDPDCHIRSAAAVALSRTDEVLADLRSDNEGKRRAAAEALKHSKDARAIPALVEALKDPRGGLNRWAASTLGMLGWKPGNTEESLLYGLITEDEFMLAGLGPDAIPALAEHVQGRIVKNTAIALKALAMMRDPQAVPPILKALHSEFGDIRDAAARSLLTIGGAQVVEALRQKRNTGKKEKWDRKSIAEIESMLRRLGERV